MVADSDTSALQAEWKGIIMLLSLVTAANHSGHSTLVPSHGDDERSLHGMLDMDKHSPSILVLNSIASLLMRNEEVVMVTKTHDPPTSSVDFDPLEFVIVTQNEQSGDQGKEEGGDGRGDQNIAKGPGSTGYDGKSNKEGEEGGGEANGDEEVIPEQLWADKESKELNDALPSCFAAFTNTSPSASKRHFKDSPGLSVKIIETGESHWPDIARLSPLEIFDSDKLNLSRKDPLKNHIATVTEFVNAYREAEDQRHMLFWKFSAYLSLVSWRKTYRRLVNWTSKGFIYALANIPLNLFKLAGAKCARSRKPKRSNKALRSEVSCLCQDERAVQRLMDHLSPIRFSHPELIPENLNDLLAALEEEGAQNSDSKHSAYNGKSSIQFHCLLIALLIGYVKALRAYNKLHKEEGRERNAGKKESKRKLGLAEDMRESQEVIWKCGRLLWTVTTSGMFDDHLQAMNQALNGVIPEHVDVYKEFSLSVGLEDQDSRDGSGDLIEEKGGEEEEDDKEDKEEGGEGGEEDGEEGGEGSEEDVGEGGEEDIGEDGEEDVAEGGEEDVEEEQRRGMHLNSVPSDTDSVVRFKHWMCIVTSYFEALRRVTVAAKQSPKPFEAKLVIATSGDDNSLLDWHKTIFDLCHQDRVAQTPGTAVPPSHLDATSLHSLANDSAKPIYLFTPKQAQDAITHLQRFIDRNRYTPNITSAFGRNPVPSESLAPTDNQKKEFIALGQVYWKGKSHCEVVAAALFMFFDNIEGLEDVRKLVLSLNIQEVSVSQLCCPVCWEVLQVLRGDKQDFQLRGYHTSFYAVELPTVLPKPVLEEMVTRFRRHLYHGLITFLEREIAQ